MHPKWSLSRALEGTKKCPRLRLDQKLPTSTKPNYLHSFQRFSLLRNHRFSMIFDPQNDTKINKTSVPSKYQPKYAHFPLLGGQHSKIIEKWSRQGISLAPEMLPKSLKITPLVPQVGPEHPTMTPNPRSGIPNLQNSSFSFPKSNYFYPFAHSNLATIVVHSFPYSFSGFQITHVRLSGLYRGRRQRA